MHLAGTPQKEIADKVGCGLRTVQRIVAKCKAEGFEEAMKNNKKN